MMAMVMIPLMIAGGFDGVEPIKRETAEYAQTELIGSHLVCFGVSAAARRFGCSREHLSRVLHGSRKPSPELRRGLARLGVTCTVDGKAFADPTVSPTALLAALKHAKEGSEMYFLGDERAYAAAVNLRRVERCCGNCRHFERDYECAGCANPKQAEFDHGAQMAKTIPDHIPETYGAYGGVGVDEGYVCDLWEAKKEGK